MQNDTLQSVYYVTGNVEDKINLIPDGAIIYTPNGKHYIKDNGILIKIGPEISEIDEALSVESHNPIANKPVAEAVNELFLSVSNGKYRMASAITDKGILTAPGATFSQMAENISKIQTEAMSTLGGMGDFSDIYIGGTPICDIADFSENDVGNEGIAGLLVSI